MPRLLIVHQNQFGYLTDTFRYCVHLRDRWELTVVCWDYGRPRVSLEGVKVVYVSRDGAIPRRLGRLLGAARREVRSGSFDAAFIVYFAGCALLRWRAPGMPMIMDVRTGADRGGPVRRRLDDALMRLERRAYRHVSIISASLAEKLRLPPSTVHLLPLGGDLLVIPPKSFDTIRLLYVGTLYRRALEKSVLGMDRFLRSSPGVELTYDIIGEGSPEDRVRLEETIAGSACAGRIRYHGPIPNAEIRPHLERANVGVAFIPLVDYYDCQPSTKVYECLLAGMPVIATDTRENRAVVTPENGVLVPDTPEGFAGGLRRIIEQRTRYNSVRIRETVAAHDWAAIVTGNLEPYIRSLLGPGGTDPATGPARQEQSVLSGERRS